MPRTLLPAALLAALATGCPHPSGTAPKAPVQTHLDSADLDVALPAQWETRIGEDNGLLHDELVHHGDLFIMISLHLRGGCSDDVAAGHPDYLPASFQPERSVPRVGGYQDVYVCMPRAGGGDLTARITVLGDIDAEAPEVREVLDAIANGAG